MLNLNIVNFINKTYISPFESKEKVKPKEKLIAVQVDSEGVIMKVRPNLGKVSSPRIYTVREVNFELSTVTLYQVDATFNLTTGEKVNCSHRDINWCGWKICSIEV